MNNPKTEEDILKIMDGETFSKITQLSQSAPIDITNPDELQGALTTCLIDLSDALDDGRIIFEKTKDEGMFHALLALALTQVFDGQIPLEVVRQH